MSDNSWMKPETKEYFDNLSRNIEANYQIAEKASP